MRLERRKLQEREKRKITALLVLVAFILTLFPTGVFADGGGKDVTGLLMTNDLQNGVINLTVKEPSNTLPLEFDFDFVFRVPVFGDIEQGYTKDIVNLGDKAIFQIASGDTFTFTPVGPVELESEGDKVGDLVIASDGTMTITFSGNERIFPETEAEKNNARHEVIIAFGGTFKYEPLNVSTEGVTETITVLGKNFDISIPPVPITIVGEKSGAQDGEYIDWAVIVHGKQGSKDIDIDGYKFSDVLTSVGTYVDGTFEINGVSDAPTYSGDTLSYQFAGETKGEQKITFRTKILDTDLYGKGKRITNTAKITDTKNKDISKSGYVDIDTGWIKKDVGEVTAFNELTGKATIVWTITANTLGATLPSAQIIDTMSANMEHIGTKVHYYKVGETNWDDGADFPPVAINGKDLTYQFNPTLNQPVMLKITTEVTDSEIGHIHKDIENKVKITWTGYSGDGDGISTQNSTNVGFNPIKKTYVDSSLNLSDHTIEWKVVVNKSNVHEYLRVLDLLVYGESFVLSKLATGDYTLVPNPITKDQATQEVAFFIGKNIYYLVFF